jgi:hypothetical protein
MWSNRSQVGVCPPPPQEQEQEWEQERRDTFCLRYYESAHRFLIIRVNRLATLRSFSLSCPTPQWAVVVWGGAGYPKNVSYASTGQ